MSETHQTSNHFGDPLCIPPAYSFTSFQRFTEYFPSYNATIGSHFVQYNPSDRPVPSSFLELLNQRNHLTKCPATCDDDVLQHQSTKDIQNSSTQNYPDNATNMEIDTFRPSALISALMDSHETNSTNTLKKLNEDNFQSTNTVKPRKRKTARQLNFHMEATKYTQCMNKGMTRSLLYCFNGCWPLPRPPQCILG